MAYTGTGTIEDPFVVSTFADFLTCVGDVGTGAGAYVKIANDLDAAAEGFEYIEPIVVEAARVYADTKTKIKNVTIAGAYMLEKGTQSSIHGTDFKNIHFQNWTVKNTTTSTVILLDLARNNTNFAHFEDCEFNIEAQSAGRNFTFTQNSALYHCAVYVEVYETNVVSILTVNSSNANDSFVKSNFYFKFHDSQIGSSGNFLTALSYSGIIFDGLSINRSSIAYFGSYGSGFGYAVFKDCTVDGTCSITSPKVSNLICLDNTTGITSTVSPIVTPEQLKSESYLQSIGWLP